MNPNDYKLAERAVKALEAIARALTPADPEPRPRPPAVRPQGDRQESPNKPPSFDG